MRLAVVVAACLAFGTANAQSKGPIYVYAKRIYTLTTPKEKACLKHIPYICGYRIKVEAVHPDAGSTCVLDESDGAKVPTCGAEASYDGGATMVSRRLPPPRVVSKSGDTCTGYSGYCGQGTSAREAEAALKKSATGLGPTTLPNAGRAGTVMPSTAPPR